MGNQSIQASNQEHSDNVLQTEDWQSILMRNTVRMLFRYGSSVAAFQKNWFQRGGEVTHRKAKACSCFPFPPVHWAHGVNLHLPWPKSSNGGWPFKKLTQESGRHSSLNMCEHVYLCSKQSKAWGLTFPQRQKVSYTPTYTNCIIFHCVLSAHIYICQTLLCFGEITKEKL